MSATLGSVLGHWGGDESRKLSPVGQDPWGEEDRVLVNTATKKEGEGERQK